MNLLPLIDVTLSRIRIRMWLERLISLLNEEEKTSLPALCDTEGYALSAEEIESVFHPILEAI